MAKNPNKQPTAAAIAAPVFKTPNNSKVAEFCHVFVQREITRGIGVEGAEACMTIGILLDKVLDAYQVYARLVEDFAGVDLERVAEYYGDNWAHIPNAKRRLLEEGINKEVRITNEMIRTHIEYLELNRQQMDSLGPRGREEVARKIQELTGSPELMTLQEGGIAA